MFITAQETARRLTVSLPTLARWRKEGRGPACFRLGKAWRYREEDVTTFIESCRYTHENFSQPNQTSSAA